MRKFPGSLQAGILRWNQYWFSKKPAQPYSLFRFIHGITLAIFLIAWWQHAREWLTTDGFHLQGEGLPPLPPAFLPWFGILQFSAITLFIAGWKPRLSASLTWLCLVYVTIVDRATAYSINSIYLFTFAVLSVFPHSTANQQIAITPIRLLQLAMVTIYFSSGWHKIVYGDWLSSPHVLETALKGIAMTDWASWALRTFPSMVWTIAQALVLMFELFSPVLFFSKRLWPLAIFAGCLFHLGIALFMKQFIYFSLQMMSFYILFVPYWSNKMISQDTK
jgi:hypothetical protein